MNIIGEIPRIHAPEPAHLRDEYMRTGQPVIITGAMEHWRAVDIWSIDYLIEHCGDNAVPVRTLSPQTGATTRTSTLRAYLQHLRHHSDASTSGSIGDVAFANVLHQVTDDVGSSRYRQSPIAELAVMIGRCTYAPLHFHGSTDAFSSQIVGHKRFVLFDPRQSAALYPNAWFDPRFYNFSRVTLAPGDEGQEATEDFPRIAELEGWECTLGPGEILYIPVHWWHAVYGSDEFNVLLVDFFPAPLRQWTFPQPGMRSLLHCALERAVQRVVPDRLIDWYLSR